MICKKKAIEALKRVVWALIVSWSFTLTADVTSNRHLIFWTNGPDRYADGSPVLDGESYALVCTKSGAVFAGFNADGTLVDAQTSTLVHSAPLALKGRCRYTDFIVDADFAAQHAKDEWKVYLLDTRRRSGELAPRDANGDLTRVNSFGETDGKVRFGATAGLQGAALLAAGSVAGTLSSADFAPVPQITDIRIVNGKAVLTVQNTVPSLDYDLAGGAKPGELKVGVAEAPVEGVKDQPITLQTEATQAAGFFKVIRAK